MQPKSWRNPQNFAQRNTVPTKFEQNATPKYWKTLEKTENKPVARCLSP